MFGLGEHARIRVCSSSFSRKSGYDCQRDGCPYRRDCGRMGIWYVVRVVELVGRSLAISVVV